MPLPPVAVDISPADAPAELRQALLESCSRTTAGAPCLDARGLPDDARASAFASIAWSDPEHVHISVKLTFDGEVIARELSFTAEDALAERWNAAGLIVATLVTVVSESAVPAPVAEPAPVPLEPEPAAEPVSVPRASPAPPPPSAAAAPPPEPSARPRIWITLAAVAGSALSRRPWRAGGEVSVQAPIAKSPLFALLGASHTQTLGSFENVRADWTMAFGGVGYAAGNADSLQALFRLEALAQRFAPSATSGSGSPTRGDRWLGGGRIGVDGLWWAAPSVGLTAGVSGRWLAGATDVTVQNQRIATEPQLTATFRLGFAVRF